MNPVSETLEANLTQLESPALRGGWNLADGHARQQPTPTQQRILDNLAPLFAEARSRPPAELDLRAQEAFLRALGQTSAPIEAGRVLTCYASSVAMEIFARALAGSGREDVALVHPTFDNIPDILKGFGLRLTPIDEDALHQRPKAVVADHVGCVFVTTPNNPTGRVLEEDNLRALAEACRERDVILTLDTSFRGFDLRAQYDHYAVLDAVGVRYVVIEDTGKLWPTLDLKAGFLVFSANCGLDLELIHSEVLLGISPFICGLIEAFADDARAGGLPLLHAFIDRNRRALRGHLQGLPGIEFPDQDSRASVERIHLGARLAEDVWFQLKSEDVHVLPCGPFHWADPREGANELRVALARPTEAIDHVGRALAAALA